MWTHALANMQKVCSPAWSPAFTTTQPGRGQAPHLHGIGRVPISVLDGQRQRSTAPLVVLSAPLQVLDWHYSKGAHFGRTSYIARSGKTHLHRSKGHLYTSFQFPPMGYRSQN